MNWPLNQAFENVWGEVEQQLEPASREALRMVFMTGAATAIDELRQGVRTNGVAGLQEALTLLDAELGRFIGREVVQ